MEPHCKVLPNYIILKLENIFVNFGGGGGEVSVNVSYVQKTIENYWFVCLPAHLLVQYYQDRAGDVHGQFELNDRFCVVTNTSWAHNLVKPVGTFTNTVFNKVYNNNFLGFHKNSHFSFLPRFREKSKDWLKCWQATQTKHISPQF